jgi:hypothetical protein
VICHAAVSASSAALRWFLLIQAFVGDSKERELTSSGSTTVSEKLARPVRRSGVPAGT